VDHRPVPNTTSSDPRKPLTTKSSIQVSSIDVANSDVRPSLWSQNWLQVPFHQNSPLRVLLPTKDHLPKLPMDHLIYADNSEQTDILNSTGPCLCHNFLTIKTPFNSQLWSRTLENTLLPSLMLLAVVAVVIWKKCCAQSSQTAPTIGQPDQHRAHLQEEGD